MSVASDGPLMKGDQQDASSSFQDFLLSDRCCPDVILVNSQKQYQQNV